MFKQKTAVGLDLGHDVVKGISLTLRGRQVMVNQRHHFNACAEGILGEDELRSSVSEWLQQVGWADSELIFGLPQYLTTTQVADFPPGAGQSLSDMVDYETRQLAGLSEESFIHDYAIMRPGHGRSNPVLIGVCRESVVNDTAEALTTAGIHVMDLAMSGLAVANAFFELHPESSNEADPQLLLDIGAESSTMIVVAAGQVLFIGSLLFGAEKYNQVLAEHLSVSVDEAEKTKRTALLNSGDTESPLYRCTQQLENELRTAVEHWRSQERPEIGNKMFSHVWLCGGGSQLRGLERYFGRTYGCPSECFGPIVDGEVSPSDVTAYGLALQGLGQACIPISLCPEEIKWLRQRESLFGYLVAAVAALAILCGLILYREYRQLVNEDQYVRERVLELRRCESLIPQLEDTRAVIRHHEKMLIPLVAKGNRGRRFLLAVEQLAAAQDENEWFIYLADDISYESGKQNKREAEEEERTSSRRSRAGGGGAVFGMFGQTRAIGDTEVHIPYVSEKILVEQLPLFRSMILAGYTRYMPDRVWVPVREIVGKLNDSALFESVDLLTEPERVGREDIFDPWVRFFQRWPTRTYKAYTLRLPLAEVDVKIPRTEDS